MALVLVTVVDTLPIVASAEAGLMASVVQFRTESAGVGLKSGLPHSNLVFSECTEWYPTAPLVATWSSLDAFLESMMALVLVAIVATPGIAGLTQACILTIGQVLFLTWPASVGF